MNPHDEHPRLDEIALLALGVLPEAEARDVVANVAPSPACIREFGELRAAADLVGYAAETAEYAPNELQSARLKSRLMREVREASDAHSADSRARAAARPPVPWLAYTAAAACLAVAFLAYFNLNAERAENTASRQQIALLRAQLDQEEQAATRARTTLAFNESVMADLLASDAQRYPVPSGLVARTGPRIVLALRKLPAPPRGKVYQAWTLHRGAHAMSPDITFVPDSTGLALVELRPSSASDVDVVAVSVEPLGGSKAPTSKPTLVRALT